MRLLKTSIKKISYIPVSIKSWNKKQEEFDCFCDQLQALSQVATGLISWSLCLSWQHPQFILNNKFHQDVHIFSLALCNPDNKSVLGLPSHSRPSLLHLFKKQSLKLEHYLHYQDLLIFSFFSIETLSSSYINVGVFENYESLQFSYQTTPTQVNSSSND